MEKIIEDHKAKSNRLQRMKKKSKSYASRIKNSISVIELKERLYEEKNTEIDGQQYYYDSWGERGFDETGYTKAEAKKEARIELLEELLRKTDHK